MEYSKKSHKAGNIMMIFLSVAGLFLVSCGTNNLTSIAPKDSQTSLWEEIRMLMDKKAYTEALAKIDTIKNDSNDKRILYVSAQLGESGLSIWDVVLDVTEQTTSKSAKSGSDNIFDLISESILGSGDVRAARITALENGIKRLVDAPQPDDSGVRNLSCFLAGVLAMPSVTDGLKVLTDVQTSLGAIQGGVIGSGSQREECPNIDKLEGNLESVTQLKDQFSLILERVKGCKFFELDQAASALNTIEKKLKSFVTSADKGCTATPGCPSGAAYCQALSLGCVQTILGGSGSATALDNKIDTCELVQNCADPSACFTLK